MAASTTEPTVLAVFGCVKDLIEGDIMASVFKREIIYNQSYANFRNTKMKLKAWKEVATMLQLNAQDKDTISALKTRYVNSDKSVQVSSSEDCQDSEKWW